MEFFDIQVNGAFGIDFNSDDLTVDQLHAATMKLAQTGVVGFFPTVITASVDQMLARIDKIASAVASVPELGRYIAGIHVEGPFVSSEPGYRGTHPLEYACDASLATTKRLLDAGRGLVKLVTLAPERDAGCQVTTWLAGQGVKVFGGHSDASFEVLQDSIHNGLSGFTHLGNGCAMDVQRHDNILHRVLALRSHLHISVIADGIHVPFWLLRSWGEMIPSDRLIVTSDSMSAAGMPAGEYLISGQPIVVDDDRRTRHRDHQYLAGSASTLLDMAKIAPGWLPNKAGAAHSVFLDNARRFFEIPRHFN